MVLHLTMCDTRSDDNQSNHRHDSKMSSESLFGNHEAPPLSVYVLNDFRSANQWLRNVCTNYAIERAVIKRLIPAASQMERAQLISIIERVSWFVLLYAAQS
jgi:hypothetical protein